MSQFLQHDDEDEDIKAIARPRVFSENRRANNGQVGFFRKRSQERSASLFSNSLLV